MLQWKHYLPHIRSTLEDFALEAQNSHYFEQYDSSFSQTIHEQKDKLLSVFDSFDTPEEKESIEDYLDFCIRNDLPYLLVISELSSVARDLLGRLASEQKCQVIAYANEHFANLEYTISQGYYDQFLRKLAKTHHLRLSHLSQLIEKHLMIHYQHHLEWMLVLISQLQGSAREGTACELDHTLCSFGKWLHNPTIPYITSTSHFKDIQKQHIALHALASNILSQHGQTTINHRNMIQLLQQLDYTSLEIGNEIAIINDMLIIGEYAKDPMTGLLGRRLFDKIIMGQIEIAKATETRCTMIMCDLDHFKEINDRYGHLAGDEVIRNFSEVLQDSLRKSDFIFRFGGEEFLILLPSTDYNKAFLLAERICQEAASQTIMYEEDIISYSVSIGVTDIDTHDLSFVTKEVIHKYIQIVDSKLYLAKSNGRNRVE